MNQNRLNNLLSMLEADPNDSFVRYAAAKEYEMLGEMEESLKYYLALKKMDPTYVGMYYHLAKLYEKLDNKAMALQTYDEGLDISKKIPDFHALSELQSAKLNLEMED